MIIDKQNVFSEAQAVTATTVKSANVVDLGADHDDVPADPEKGDLIVAVNVATAFAASGAVSIVVKLQGSDTLSGGNLASPQDLVESPSMGPKAKLVPGFGWLLRVPKTLSYRYLQLDYTSTAAPTAGALDATLVLDVQTNPATS